MKLQEIQKLEKEIVTDIENLMSLYSKITEKIKDEISEEEYEEIKKMRNKWKEISEKITTLSHEKIENQNSIQRIEDGQKIAPRVPLKEIIEDLVKGWTVEDYEEAIKCCDEVESFYKSDSYVEFSRKGIIQKTEQYIIKYEEKKAREKKIQKEEQKRQEEEKIIEEIKELILAPDTGKGTVIEIRDPWCDKKGHIQWSDRQPMAVSDKFLELRKYGIEPAWVVPESAYGYVDTKGGDVKDTRTTMIRYSPDKDGELSCSMLRLARKEKVRELQENLDERYDKPGVISVNFCAYKYDYQKGEFKMYVTQRDLINAGFLPEDLGWKAVRVAKKDFIDADKEKGLTTQEIGGIKGFVKRLLGKFKEIGEK